MTEKEILLEALYNRDEVAQILEVAKYVDSEAWAAPFLEKFSNRRRESVEKARKGLWHATLAIKTFPFMNFMEEAKKIAIAPPVII